MRSYSIFVRTHDRRLEFRFSALLRLSPLTFGIASARFVIMEKNEAVSPVQIFQTLNAYQHSAVLKAALELDLFTAIGETDATADELATRCSAAERSAAAWRNGGTNSSVASTALLACAALNVSSSTVERSRDNSSSAAAAAVDVICQRT
jgi:hypothetical protein